MQQSKNYASAYFPQYRKQLGCAGDAQSRSGYYRRGFAYYTNGEFLLAIEDLDSSIALDAYNAQAFALRGVIFSGGGLIDRAIADLERAIELGLPPTNEKTVRDLLRTLE